MQAPHIKIGIFILLIVGGIGYFANQGSIPSGVESYNVDYDTAIALKKQYGVTTQHSLIEIASDGTAKSSITHLATLADVLKTI